VYGRGGVSGCGQAGLRGVTLGSILVIRAPEADHLRWLVRWVGGVGVRLGEGGPAMGLPHGTVTFVVTPLKGSTRRWEAHPAGIPAATTWYRRGGPQAVGCGAAG
jgi:hypothetical protein